MDKWESLLKRFLRSESSDPENKIVFHALRDGLIDDSFRQAIDDAMSDKDMPEYIDRMKPVSEEIFRNICERRKKTLSGQRLIIPGWLKIAAAVVITFTVSWMTFNNKTPKEELLQAMNIITVPAGQTVNLTLADGTTIWLNSRTSLKFPSLFTGDRREVILDGEGFFNVAHNPEIPFVVQTGRYSIEALGTQFNVEAYREDADFTTSLLDGSVRVASVSDTSQTVILQPNSLVRLYEGRLVTETITDFNYYRWREGLISFNNMPFTALMEKFEKCFGIKIIIQNNQIMKYAPTGKFRQSDGLDYALRVLQHDFNFRFSRDEENNVIYIK